jgi:hypothetical protein
LPDIPNTGSLQRTGFLAIRLRPHNPPTSQYCGDLAKSVTSRGRVAHGEELRHTYVVLFADCRVFWCADEFHSRTQGLWARTRRCSWPANFENVPLVVSAFSSGRAVPTAVVGEPDLLSRKRAITTCEFDATGQPAIGHIRFEIGYASRRINREESFRHSNFRAHAPKMRVQITRANPPANVTLGTKNDHPPSSHCGLQMKAVNDGVDAPRRGRDRRTIDRERRKR